MFRKPPDSSRRFLLATIGLSIRASLLLAQTQTVRPLDEQFPALHRIDNFQRYTTSDGLSSDICRALLIDRKGILWIGTYDGLNRFDGKQFLVFRTNHRDPNSISGNAISTLYEDRNEVIWIGTYDAGLTAYEKKTNRFFRYTHSEKDSTTLSHNAVRGVFQDHSGTIWIATDGGLNRLVKHNRNVQTSMAGQLDLASFVHYANNPLDTNSIAHNQVHSIVEDATGAILIAFYVGGVDRFDKNKGVFAHYKGDPRFPHQAQETKMDGLFEGPSGTLYGSIKNGLYSYDPASNDMKFFKLGSDLNVRAICEDNHRTVWLSTFTLGLFELARSQTEFLYHRPSGYPSNSPNGLVFDIVQDSAGNLWVAGSGDGLFKFSPRARQFKSYALKDKEGTLGVFDITGGFFWVEDGKKISRYDHTLLPHSWQMPQMLRAFHEGKDNTAWIGMNGLGLCELDMKTNALSYFTEANGYQLKGRNFILSMCEDDNGFLWLGTNYLGLLKFDTKNRRFISAYLHDPNDRQTLSGNKVASLFSSQDGTLWAGTFSNGLNQFDASTGKFVNWQHDPEDSTSLSANSITNISEDRENNIWATTSHGVSKLDCKTGKFTRFFRGNGSASETAQFAVQDKNGDMWIGYLQGGLARLNPKTGQFTAYGTSDGLPPNSATPYVRPNGEIVLPNDAITVFHPDSIRPSTFVPNIVLTSFKIFEKAMLLQEDSVGYRQVTMPHGSNFFSFGFAALDLTVPERNQHAYKLEGYEENWNYVGNEREAHYTKVAPGEYVFRVKGTNSDGVWSTNEASVRIVITPPWWKTAWAYGSYGVLFVLGLYSFRRYETKRGRMKQQAKLDRLESQKRLQQEFFKQLIETQEAERKRIASELHDSLGQHLLIVNNELQLYQQGKGQNDPDIRRTTEIVKDAIKEVREIAANLHPHHLEKLGFRTAVEAMIEQVSRSTPVKFKTAMEDVDSLLSTETKISLYRVLQEAVANIMRHSGATVASITISATEDEVHAVIKDNGKGFSSGSSENERQGFGLKSMAERVRLMSGTITFDSPPGEGTQVDVHIPVQT